MLKEEFNLVKMIEEDVKNFPITMIANLAVILLWAITIMINPSLIYTIVGKIAPFITLFAVIAFSVEYNKNFKNHFKIGLLNVLPYIMFLIGKEAFLFLYIGMGAEGKKYGKIMFGAYILLFGIWDISKIIYKFSVQEKKFDTGETIARCLLGPLKGFAYAAGISLITFLIWGAISAITGWQ